MIAICPKCKNHEWDKTVEGNKITCPKCGMSWEFQKRPLYILTGCSGVGKTSTGVELQRLTEEFVVLDADMFHNIMPSETEEELHRRMKEGRGITDEGWLKGSADYNEYFRTHTVIGDVEFESMDISDVTTGEAARKVLEWLREKELESN